MYFFVTGLDACFVGVPLDAGTCNRPGTRFGPRQIRTESVFIRDYNYATGNTGFMYCAIEVPLGF